MRRRRLLLLSVCVSLWGWDWPRLPRFPAPPPPPRPPEPRHLSAAPRGAAPGPAAAAANRIAPRAGRLSLAARADRPAPGDGPAPHRRPLLAGSDSSFQPLFFAFFFFLNQRDPLCCFFSSMGRATNSTGVRCGFFPPSPRRGPHNSRRCCDLLVKRKSFKIPFA